MGSIINELLKLHGWEAYLLVGTLIFTECGLVVTFFIPGELAAVAGGVLVNYHRADLGAMLLVANAAAIGGYFVGYAIGNRIGPWLLSHRPLKGQASVARAQHFIDRFGGPGVLVGRFVAIVRALVAPLAGIGDVSWRSFALFNVIGGAIWASGYVALGDVLGRQYSHVVGSIGHWSLVVVGAVVVLLVANHLRTRHRAQPDRPTQ